MKDYWDRLFIVNRAYNSLCTYQAVIFVKGDSKEDKKWIDYSKKDLEWGMEEQKFSEEDKKSIRDFIEGITETL